MAWDLGIAALLEFAALSVVVGLIVELICGPESQDWLWVRVSVVYFVIGAWLTDAWFGWVSAGDVSLEEVLLVGLAPLPAVVLVTRAMYRGDGRRSGKHGKSSCAPGDPTPRAL